jgi:hypothetical protein
MARARTVRSTGVASNTRCPLISSTPLHPKAQCLRLRRQSRAPLGLISPLPSMVHAAGAVSSKSHRPAPSTRMLLPKVKLTFFTFSPLAKRADKYITATDGLAIYRAWLESQVEVQKAKIQAMSKQYSIPIPQLNDNLDPLDFPPLGMIPATMANDTAITTTTTNNFRGQRRSPPEVPSTPKAPRLEPAQLHIPKSAPGYQYHRHEGPMTMTTPGVAVTTYAHENPDSATGGAPRKIDISYKTTPCRHFTLNRGWCPWGDDCCL